MYPAARRPGVYLPEFTFKARHLASLQAKTRHTRISHKTKKSGPASLLQIPSNEEWEKGPARIRVYRDPAPWSFTAVVPRLWRSDNEDDSKKGQSVLCIPWEKNRSPHLVGDGYFFLILKTVGWRFLCAQWSRKAYLISVDSWGSRSLGLEIMMAVLSTN